MIVILKQDTPKEEVGKVVHHFEQKGLSIHLSEGQRTTIVGLVGDTAAIDINDVKAIPCVEDAKRVQEPFKKANRKFHEDDTIVRAGSVVLGGGHFSVIAGPCSVENEEQIAALAKAVLQAGAQGLRGGAFKPRTSPYAFQGLEEKGLELLAHAKKESGLPIVSEITDSADIPLFQDVDIIQVGARSMQNFRLLKNLGGIRKPILLKRGLSNSIEELLMSAEYIMAEGNEQVILCERGIRTFETATRNTLDISAVPVLKRLSHLPVVVDPSHAGGAAWLVPSLAKAAVAAGADGLLIEVHNNPEKALSDGAQSLTPAQFERLMKTLRQYASLEGKTMRE